MSAATISGGLITGISVEKSSDVLFVIGMRVLSAKAVWRIRMTRVPTSQMGNFELAVWQIST